MPCNTHVTSVASTRKLKRKAHCIDFGNSGSVTVVCKIATSLFSKVKWSRYRPGVAQMVGRGIALLFHDRGTRRGWVVSSTPRPHFAPGKDPVPILQEARWAPGPIRTGGKSRPNLDSIPDRPARSQLLYRLSYPAHLTSLSSCPLWTRLCIAISVRAVCVKYT